MTRVFQFIFGLVFAICLGIQPAIAIERPFDLTGTGTLEVFTDNNGQLHLQDLHSYTTYRGKGALRKRFHTLHIESLRKS